jgi:hypothetical protein
MGFACPPVGREFVIWDFEWHAFCEPMERRGEIWVN